MELSEKEIAYAVKILDTICEMLDGEELRYTRSDEDMAVLLDCAGDDFPVKIIFRIIPEKKLVMVYSPLSFTIPEDGRNTVALALTMLNDCIWDGVWTENLGRGAVQFCVTNSYRDSILGKECFKSMMHNAFSAVDEVSGKLFILGKGNMSLQQFYDSVFRTDSENGSE